MQHGFTPKKEETMDRMKRKKWNVRELFLMVDEGLRKKGLRPEKILNYSCAGSGSEMILSEEFDIVPYIVHGSSEGIYLSMILETGDDALVFSSHKPRLNLGTYKTLYTDKDAYKKMAMLGNGLQRNRVLVAIRIYSERFKQCDRYHRLFDRYWRREWRRQHGWRR